MSLRVGVIGAGLMGTTHVRLLGLSVPAAEVVAISDAIAESGERLAGEAGVDTVHTDALELIRDPGVDAVIVASPGDTHEAFVLACFEAGKPVLCEKPLAITSQAARRVLDAEVALGRRLVQVGFMRRFDPGYVDMQRRIEAGAIGTPVLAYSTHRNSTVPHAFDSEMIIKDTVVHDVDTVRWLLGQEIVKATVLTPRPTSRAAEGVRDPQLVLLETDEGLIVTVEAFVNAQYAYDIRCEIVGETGTLTLADPTTVHLYQEGRRATDLSMRFQERFASAYVHELQSWVASVVEGAPPAGASAWDGYAAAAVCEAAFESLTSARPVEVALGERPTLYPGGGSLVGHGG